MAWMSSGRSNAELVRNMHHHKLIHSDVILQAFLSVDRGHFVPPEKRNEAYNDQPVHQPPFHLSAPHMYATVVQALDLSEGLSFLNIGSGTGYLSCIVARIVGPAINHGIEQHQELVEHAMSRCAVVPELRDLNFIRFRCGDAFSLCNPAGGLKYDRIYVGAEVQVNHSFMIRELLAIGGILVAPRESELVAITRVSEDTFMSKTLATVKFQSLLAPEARTAKLKGRIDLTEPIGEKISSASSSGIATAKVVRV